MSNFSAGTLVMMKAPANFARHELAPKDGAIGEIMNGDAYLSYLKVGQVCVDFPQYPSGRKTDWWAVPTAYLIPLSDPDLAKEIENEDNFKEDSFQKKYEEEYSK